MADGHVACSPGGTSSGASAFAAPMSPFIVPMRSRMPRAAGIEAARPKSSCQIWGGGEASRCQIWAVVREEGCGDEVVGKAV